MRTWERPITLVAAAATAVVLAACGPDEPAPDDDGDDVEAPILEDDEDEDDGFDDDLFDDDGTDPEASDPDATDPDATDPDATDPDLGDPDASDEGTDTTDEASDDTSDEDGTASADDDVERLDVEATSEVAERDAVDARLIVTDVRVGAHDGFDRVVIEFAGEGESGWFIEPTDEPLAQGSGMPIEVAADDTLRVAVSQVVLPGDEPEAVDPDARFETEVVEGTDDGPIVEVVRDTLFEGIETYVIGLDEERPYRVERFSEPERIVIDIES